MSLSTESRKTERRLALETPFARDQERSIARKADRGREPRNLRQLLDWFAYICADEDLWAIHKNELWRDYGIHAQGGSALGTLAWSDRFRRYLENSISECDEDGYYRRPVAAAIFRIKLRREHDAWHLCALMANKGDWTAHAQRVGYPVTDMGHIVRGVLQALWHEYSQQKLMVA